VVVFLVIIIVALLTVDAAIALSFTIVDRTHAEIPAAKAVNNPKPATLAFELTATLVGIARSAFFLRSFHAFRFFLRKPSSPES
jgi:hypothetical protein